MSLQDISAANVGRHRRVVPNPSVTARLNISVLRVDFMDVELLCYDCFVSKTSGIIDKIGDEGGDNFRESYDDKTDEGVHNSVFGSLELAGIAS